MPLFAESNSDVTILTVAMAAITSLAMFGSAVIGYLGGRDKLRFDSGFLLMKQKIETLEGDVKVCQEDRARLAARVEHLEERAARSEGLARGVAADKARDDARRGTP